MIINIDIHTKNNYTEAKNIKQTLRTIQTEPSKTIANHAKTVTKQPRPSNTPLKNHSKPVQKTFKPVQNQSKPVQNHSKTIPKLMETIQKPYRTMQKQFKHRWTTIPSSFTSAIYFFVFGLERFYPSEEPSKGTHVAKHETCIFFHEKPNPNLIVDVLMVDCWFFL